MCNLEALGLEPLELDDQAKLLPAMRSDLLKGLEDAKQKIENMDFFPNPIVLPSSLPPLKTHIKLTPSFFSKRLPCA
jgi:hypothetical protein